MMLLQRLKLFKTGQFPNYLIIQGFVQLSF
jgi:hypothetical protein